MQGTDCILDVRVTYTDATSYRNKDPQKVLEAVERLKKKKYLQPCSDQRCHFTPFAVSLYRLVVKEKIFFINNLTENQVQNTGKAYSHLCGFLWARLSITIVIASHMCLIGSIVPNYHMSTGRTPWDDAADTDILKY
jgi:hypothetical protein